jgi:hypothetical protein
MKKLTAILLAAVMIVLPLDMSYGKGGKARGIAGKGKAGMGSFFKGKFKKAAWVKKWAGKKQVKRDKGEDKATAKKVDRR